MTQSLQPAHCDFEYSDKMGLSAFEPQLTQDLGLDPAQPQLSPLASLAGKRWSHITGQNIIKFVLPLTRNDLVWGSAETSAVRSHFAPEVQFILVLRCLEETLLTSAAFSQITHKT